MSFLQRFGKKQETTEEPVEKKRPMQTLVTRTIDYIPYSSQVKTFHHNLQELRDWWPVLLPLLAWIGWHTYRTERKKVLEEARRMH